MKAMSVRQIDNATLDNVKKAARRAGKSVNRFVVELLENTVDRTPGRYHDLDKLFGTWDEEEFRLISKATRNQRKTDKELWK